MAILLALLTCGLVLADAANERRVVMFVAPPCAGKGTQSPNIVKALGIPHLSTGDMLRAAVAKGTKAGLEAKAAMDSGKLVTDDIVNEIIAERITSPDCKKGFLLDGYPRDVAQAKYLDRILAGTGGATIDVIEIIVPESGLKICIKGRWMSKTGDSYNSQFIGGRRPKSLPAGAKPVCDPNDLAHCNMRDDVTGEPLYRRSDDNLEVLKTRLIEYHEETKPLLDYYGSRVHQVNGNQVEVKVWAEVKAALGISDGPEALAAPAQLRNKDLGLVVILLVLVAVVGVVMHFAKKAIVSGHSLAAPLL